MAQYWAYGLTNEGDPQLLGPFEENNEAQEAGAELNQMRVVYAPDRQSAIRQVQQRRPRPAPQRADSTPDYFDFEVKDE